MPRVLTALGLLALVLAVAGYVAGWQLGWIELIVLASACALALVAAAPFVIGRMRIDVERSLSAPRVRVGDPAQAIIDVRNPRQTALRPRTIDDRVGDGRTPVQHRQLRVPRLAGGATHRVEYPLPTRRRGRYEVGPAVLSRSDPLHLMRREVRHTGTDVLWVHPRYEAVPALPVGFAKDLEGPTTDTSPIGDVAFHSLREYQPGDDYRHIHWMSTARSFDATPLVRHYVDNRRPHLGVVFDTRAEAMSPAEFEVAVEITASMTVSALAQREPATVWSPAGPTFGRSAPGTRDDLLDRLSLVAQSAETADVTATALALLRSDRGVSAIALVTGGAPSIELLGFVTQLRRRARVIVVRVWPPGEVLADVLPGARLIDVDSRTAFVHAWGALT